MIVDLFAGAGGVSLALRDVYGRDPDVAINHDATAIAVHAANHPNTRHLHGDVWHYAPRDVVGDCTVWHLHASPTCTWFSQAKGAPLDRWEATRVRALAWVVVRWARDVGPRLITLENVPPFEHWGPLDANGRPQANKRGFTFRRFVRELQRHGYTVDWRVLTACDYGAPTSRKRLFLVARKDGLPIAWPRPTHGPGCATPHRGAHEVIDWSIPTPSIFGRPRPLANATLRRIARGVRKFVIESAEPFIVPVSHAGDERVHAVGDPLRTITASSRSPFALVAPTLIHQSNGERVGQEPRIYDLQKPLGTVVAQGVKHALVHAFLAKHYGGNETPGSPLHAPIGTVTTQDHHHLVEVRTAGDKSAAVRAFLTKFYGTSTGQDVQLPLGTVTSGGWKHGLVTVEGHPYQIADIGMRMLDPRELARAHDFDEMVLDRDVHGRPVTKTAQIRLIGNSVPRRLAAAVIGANRASTSVALGAIA